MKLTTNFNLEEFIKSATADRYNILNCPNNEECSNIQNLAEQLQIIRNEYNRPIIIDSGYRNKALNDIVKGAKNSDHLFGAAADIHTLSDKSADNKELFDIIVTLAKKGKIQLRQIIDEYNYNWIHISINHQKNKMKNNEILHLG